MGGGFYFLRSYGIVQLLAVGASDQGEQRLQQVDGELSPPGKASLPIYRLLLSFYGTV